MSLDVGLLLMRLLVAWLIALHGLGKLGLAGGAGLDRTAAFFEATGYRPGRVFALIAAFSELGAALLLILGLLTPLAGAAAVAVLLTAALAVPKNPPGDPRIELARSLAIVPAGIVFTGAGGYSLDALLAFSLPLWGSAGLIVAALLAVVVGDRMVRRPMVPTPT